MHTPVCKCAITLICAAVATAGSAQAVSAQATDQREAASKRQTRLVTPFVAMGDDLAPGAGGAFTFVWTRTLSIEAEASLGTDAARSSLSLLYSVPRLGRFAPYLAGGLGVQRDEFETALTGVGFVTRKKTEFAVNIGSGVTVPVSSRWSYRADFRWYNPDNEWAESWRVYSGVVFGLHR